MDWLSNLVARLFGRHFPDSTEQVLRRVAEDVAIMKEKLMAVDFTALQQAEDALKALLLNTVVPLLQKVADGPADQAAADALAKEAQDMVDAVTAAIPKAPTP